MLEKTIEELNKNLIEVPQKFSSIPDENLSYKASKEKWSKKEILGHLCDSAINNYSRFIRGQFETEPMDARNYSQNEWVEFNGYKDLTSYELISLWTALNRQILNIISRVKPDKLNLKCVYGDEVYTLQYLMEDYVVHMNHHLKQIFDD